MESRFEKKFSYRRFNRRKYEEGEIVSEYMLKQLLAERKNEEHYLSHFSFPEDALHYFQNTVNHRGKHSISGYNGPCFAERIYIDIDSNSYGEALESCKKLIKYLLELGFLAGNLDVFFSGKKGFHTGISPAPFGLAPGPTFDKQCKELCNEIGNKAGITIDQSIYFKVALLRAPFSKHPSTNLFKNPITPVSILSGEVTVGGLLERCRFPFDQSKHVAPTEPSVCLKDYWQKIAQRRPQAEYIHNPSGENKYPPFEINWEEGKIEWPYWNATFFKLAALARIKGLSPEECDVQIRRLRDLNQTPNYPYFTDSELTATIRSAYSSPNNYHVSLRDPAIEGLVVLNCAAK